jgi:hypothetical protein
MQAGNRRPPRPERIHGSQIAGPERAVEFKVGGQDGVRIGHRDAPHGSAENYDDAPAGATSGKRMAWA